MTLRKKLFMMFLVTGALILLLMGVWNYTKFRKSQLVIIHTNVNSQLELLDFSLTSFFHEVENNVQTLAENDLVRSREDANFTNFLNADPANFKYSIGDLERSIINVLNTFRITHPYVNSVYMGRENGSFVRSHPRTQPTQYDPRDRPWYLLAKENPGKVMMTEPYQSLTAPDVNIGVVTALLDQNGKVFGVVGTDVTLINLTNFIAGFNIGYSGQLLLVDGQGTILADKNEEFLFSNISSLLGEKANELMEKDRGLVKFENQYFFFFTSPQLGWKIVAAIPISVINQEVRGLAFYPLLSLLLTIILFGFLTQFGLNSLVLKPLRELSEVTQHITRSGRMDQQINIRSNDEIGILGTAFSQMITVRKQIEEVLQQERDLAKALGEATSILGTTLDFEKVLDQILEQVSHVVPIDSANFMLIKDGTAKISRSKGYERYGLEKIISKAVFKISEVPSLKTMLESKEPILITDTAAYPGWVSIKGQEFLRSYAGAPIIVRDKVIGFLNIDSATPKFFSKTHLKTLDTFASQAAIAIDNAQLHEQVQKHAYELKRQIAAATKELHRRANELEGLYKIGKEITSTLELEAMLQIITNDAAEIVNADKSIIQLVDKEQKRLINVVGSGYSQDELAEYSYKEFQESLGGWVLTERIPVFVEDIQKDKRIRGKALNRAAREGNKSIAIAPLEISGTVIGTLSVINKKGKRVFSPDSLNLITMLASQASIAIQNARLYEQAQEADRLKSAFLASMSHELRTPLNSIIGFTGIMLQGLVGSLNDEQTKQMRMVQSSAAHLLELINDVLDISKIEAGQLKINLELFDLRQLIEKVVQTITPLVNQKGLVLHVDIDSDINNISSDRLRVEQILINLLNNAIKFTEKGEIKLVCLIKKNRVEISIFDTGIGIKKEDLKFLFKPFRQVDTGLSRQYEGTGLGLSICKRLVEKLGGEIWVQSQWGTGSSFTFSLPLDNQES